MAQWQPSELPEDLPRTPEGWIDFEALLEGITEDDLRRDGLTELDLDDEVDPGLPA
jgi:hypothetical protein